MVVNENKIVWKESFILWGLLGLSLALLMFIYFDGLSVMVQWWESREEYGHGFMIPFISAFLIWQKKDQLEKIEFEKSWLGAVLVVIGLFLFYMGELSAIYTVIQYAFLIGLFGVVLSLIGAKAFKVILVPMIILVFMIPLPNFLFYNLSSQLQLISSQIGVAVIRLFDISVFLEGNVIDLGVFKLQVVEACSGLNYFIPTDDIGVYIGIFFYWCFLEKSVHFSIFNSNNYFDE